ncbi:exopolyphosphatase [bacterium]|nr:exopolyphosphatase [bacterium]MCI0602406.1 exopolyphosphatase [bacterium]
MRLVTRGDMDGLTCSVLITEMEDIDSIWLIHPQDITDKQFIVRSDDVFANLPYHPECGMWFDHHLLTDSNEKPPPDFKGMYRQAPSTARVIYEYYNSPKLHRFEKLIAETDRMDSANLTMDDVLDPKDYVLLGFTVDPRTGLGRFEDYFLSLVKALKDFTIEEVLEMPEVQSRVDLMRSQWEEFKSLTTKHSRMEKNVVVTDFRDVDPIPVGNRFLVYTLFPDANVSLRIHWGPQKQHVAVVIGHAIFNRTCKVNIGELMSEYGGGGHMGAGSALLWEESAEESIKDIIKKLQT